MRNTKVLIILLLTFSFNGYAQVASPSAPKYYWSTKEFSKEVALYRAKSFVLHSILNTTEDVAEFEMDPLAAASSGELTSLVYLSKQLNKEGLILGFFGDKWNSSGVIYQAYAFKNFETSKAIALLDKIEKMVNQKSKYLNADPGSNNVTFRFEDLSFIITMGVQTNIRVFWDDFDANWDYTAFKRTKKRLLKKLE